MPLFFGKNATVAPEVSLQDGLLDIYVYPGFSETELLSYYTAMMDGGYSGDGKVQHYQARKLKVKTFPKLKVIADGAVLTKGRVTFKVRPGALRIITTKKSLDPESLQNDATEIIEPEFTALISKKKHLLKRGVL